MLNVLIVDETYCVGWVGDFCKLGEMGYCVAGKALSAKEALDF
jgi:YesN/AraC family two-component response regulator